VCFLFARTKKKKTKKTMLRRFTTATKINNSIVTRSAVTFSSSLIPSTTEVFVNKRLQSDSNNNKQESEVEREARMRQEMMNKMMGGRNPFSGMFGQQQGGGAASNNNTGSNSQGFDTSNYNHWANTPFHRSLRFWSSITIVFTGIYLMRRMGLMGDYSHLTVPFYAASPADQTKWILFIFNVEDARRRQLVQQWETSGAKNQYLTFFDFVDSQEQYWRSSPNFSGDQVIAAVAGAMRTQGPPRAITSIKAVLNTSNFFSSTIFGATGNPTEQRAQRIDTMMNNLGTAFNPMSALMGGIGGGSSRVASTSTTGSSAPQQVVGNSGGGLYAMPTGFVSPSQQQQYGGMNHYQLMNQQQQQGGAFGNSSRPQFGGSQQQPQQQYFMGTTNPYGQVPSGFVGGGVPHQQAQFPNNIIASPLNSISSGAGSSSLANDTSVVNNSDNNKKDGPHSCEVRFINDNTPVVDPLARPNTSPVGAAEMKNL
jgi:hypothetical protein